MFFIYDIVASRIRIQVPVNNPEKIIIQIVFFFLPIESIDGYDLRPAGEVGEVQLLGLRHHHAPARPGHVGHREVEAEDLPEVKTLKIPNIFY